MEILLGICLVQSRYGEDTAYGRRLGQALTRLGCHVLEVDTSEEINVGDLETHFRCPQLIHGFHLVKSGLACQEIARRSRLPLVITCTGTDVFVDLQTPILNEQVRTVLSTADKVVVPFYGMLPYLKEFLPEDSRFRVIPKGVRAAPPSDLPELSVTPLPPHARVVVVPGAVVPVKNTLFAIQALEPLLGRIPDLHLVILGNHLDQEYGQLVAQAAAGQPWIRLVPELSPGEMSRWYAQADVILNVSHAEGGSQCLLEAMSLGAAVLASDIPGNRAYIIDEFANPGRGNGFLYFTSPSPEGFRRIHDQDDLASKLEFILRQHETRAAVGQRAGAWVKENLNPDLEAFLYLELYRSLIER
ncbi:MAG: Glycosyl transferase, group 1 family protein [Candidatus Ozemobacter sibiricus]|jgi:glycosyltransferase involved in cell wall biosynthesis|uniref:Glycosyl transferase, group 1 family protein n=1 Tax=Candidatus Ozemobacter sibiricus TaxID=2268124 RepID=A0A367ZT28_9BACT|nr:MAG: Glycosyl transferase, group 1 family protein [Candidatus Ozemobacter sibiricus]